LLHHHHPSAELTQNPWVTVLLLLVNRERTSLQALCFVKLMCGFVEEKSCENRKNHAAKSCHQLKKARAGN
jgi:hypothetical protein